MTRHDSKIVLIGGDEAEGPGGEAAGGSPPTQQSTINRLYLALSEASDDIRRATDALTLESEAMRMALDAMKRIQATTVLCSSRLLAIREIGDPGVVAAKHEALAKPLSLAATATLAVNASIASSSNALTEASLCIIRAGELFQEASRAAGKSSAPLRSSAVDGKAHGDVRILSSR